MTIIYPVILLASFGLVLGIVLGFASKKFHVFSEAMTQKIYATLPNVNCGACGYKTCLAFAKAVTEGKKEAVGCIPGGPETAHAIGDILGISVTPADPLMAVVHCKGGKNEAANRFVYDGIEDCHAAILTSNGPKTCIDGCLGLGTCVRACPFNAISVSKNQVAVVDPEKCTGCGACISSCPRSLIGLIPRVHKIFLACANHDRGSKVTSYCTAGCTSCTLCVKATPSGAIEMNDNLPILDYKTAENFVVAAHSCPEHCFVDLVKFRPKVNIDGKCDGCTECVSSCPTYAISGEKGIRHVVDKDKCIGCGLCLNTCHVHAFSMWGGLGYTDNNRSRRLRT